MENSRRVLAMLLLALTCGTIRADDSVSAAFTFDLADGWSDKPAAEIEGTGEEIEYVPPQGNASVFFKVSVRLSDDY